MDKRKTTLERFLSRCRVEKRETGDLAEPERVRRERIVFAARCVCRARLCLLGGLLCFRFRGKPRVLTLFLRALPRLGVVRFFRVVLDSAGFHIGGNCAAIGERAKPTTDVCDLRRIGKIADLVDLD